MKDGLFHYIRLSGIPFVQGANKLKIEFPASEGAGQGRPSSFLYVKVDESRTGRYMHLSGRLVLANMLRENLLFKVRDKNHTLLTRFVCCGLKQFQ